MKLIYYVKRAGSFEPLLQYISPTTIAEDEIYARQLCNYFIVNNREYEVLSNEMESDEDVIVLTERGVPYLFSDEKTFTEGIHIEVREYKEFGNMPLLTTITCKNHWEVIRYLIKDSIKIDGFEYMSIDSREIDEDRQVYVLYVNVIKNS